LSLEKDGLTLLSDSKLAISQQIALIIRNQVTSGSPAEKAGVMLEQGFLLSLAHLFFLV